LFAFSEALFRSHFEELVGALRSEFANVNGGVPTPDLGPPGLEGRYF